MKKLIYLFLTVLIVACSGDDDSNSGVTRNAQFVGGWLLEYDEDEGGGSVVIIFNADGTGNDTETYDGDTYTSSFTWSTTSTLLTITTTQGDIEEVEVVEYNFITNDQVRLIDIEDGETTILNRIAD